PSGQAAKSERRAYRRHVQERAPFPRAIRCATLARLRNIGGFAQKRGSPRPKLRNASKAIANAARSAASAPTAGGPMVKTAGEGTGGTRMGTLKKVAWAS